MSERNRVVSAIDTSRENAPAREVGTKSLALRVASEIADDDAAIVLKGVQKSFRRTKRKREYTTLKSELIRILKFQRRVFEPVEVIEALKSVDLAIPKGKTVGIIGRNGSGKSTLLKLMTGIYAPTVGSVSVDGRISALLELGAGFHPDFTGRENIIINGIILGMSRKDLTARTPEIIEFAELGEFIDEPVRTYSSGMFMRLAFAVATHVDPDILIIDEILSVGDEHFSRKSMARMEEFKAQGKTIVLVTHGLDTVRTWCDIAVWVDGGTVREVGDPEAVVGAYKRAVDAAEAVAQDVSPLRAPGLPLPTPLENTMKPPFSLSSLEVRPEGSIAHVGVKFDVHEASEFELSVSVQDNKGSKLFWSKLAFDVQTAGPQEAQLSFEGSLLPNASLTVVASAQPPAPHSPQELRAEIRR